MSKNHIEEVAKIFGVELNEEFKLKKHAEIYKFTEEGLAYYPNGSREWRIAPFTLNGLLRGEYEVEKLPWKPKNGDIFCYVYWQRNTRTNKWEIGISVGTFCDRYSQHNFYADVGNCFRTRKETEEQKYEIFKRLTGKEWNETYGKGGDDNAVD